MKISTTRFGDLNVNREDIISFPEGILGFEENKRFFLVDPGDKTLILWLQSVDNGGVAFPVIEPRIFKPDYRISLLPSELNSLALSQSSDAVVYAIITIPQNVSEMSANLKAPVVINNQTKTARQIVLQDNKLSVKFEMYKELKKYIVNYSSDDSTRTRESLQIDTKPASNEIVGATTNSPKTASADSNS